MRKLSSQRTSTGKPPFAADDKRQAAGMIQCVALLRGINVGRAKRIAMAELRSLIGRLGVSEVRTVLNSGNVVFRAPRRSVSKLGPAIEAAIQGRFGFPVPVTVLTADELDAIVAANAQPQAATNPSRFHVAFVATSAALGNAAPLLGESWLPDALAVGNKAAYLWCANGTINSRLMQAFARATGDASTTRSWATVRKLQAAAGASRTAP
jgi:uncharacterized protein (DUF1697 family)